MAQPGNTYVDGIFVPLPGATTQITSSGLNYDFSPFVSTSMTFGGPTNGPTSNDPSNLNGNPNYTGDPFNHSIMTTHSNVGITFDLQAIMLANPGITVFNANGGGACSPSCEVFVLIDGGLVVQAGPFGYNNFQVVSVPIPPTASFLTLATGDGNTGSINCAHGYFGDPFLSNGSPPCALSFSQPVPGSLQVENIGCTPLNPYVTAYTFNQGAFPGGWFFGIDIGWANLISQATNPLGPPTNGFFDANGGSLWILPAGVPPGLTIYAVTIDIEPVTGQPNPTSAISFTTT
ncbi:MAG: hypothetical protein HRU14_13875 [Planctomycetes bacterium]|nr:hypothetical protein [Planctomycetota bacterium]